MLHHFNKKNIKSYFTLAIAFVLFFLFTNTSDAASLSISPASSRVSIGDIVSVKVSASTNGKYINNADGVIRFPSELLDVISISKRSSIFSLWVEEPQFSNLNGTISFNGGIPNPGYIGSGGEVISITLRAKKAGDATIVFSEAAIRENDGLGTDILSSKNSGTVKIEAAADSVIAPPPVVSGTPSAPTIVSSTHPESNKWYNNQTVELHWDVPDDAISVSTSISKNPGSTPTTVYTPPVGKKTISDIGDGVWYFNVRFKNKSGWGAVAHFKIQIDTVSPKPFKITFSKGNTSDEPRPAPNFSTTDALSGVNFYEVKIDENPYSRVTNKEVGSGLYTLPSQDPGLHTILVKAVDYAGNETVQMSDFTIIPIDTPEIKDYQSELNDSDSLKITGVSYPRISVEVVIEDSSGQKTSQIYDTLASGEFSAVWLKKLPVGTYSFKIRAIDSRGAKSEFTKSINFTINKSSLLNAGTLILNWLSLVILILILLGVLALLIFYFVYRGYKIKNSVDSRIKNFESSVHKAFDILRDNVREQIISLEKAKTKRELTKEEEKIVKKLQNNLTKAEKYLEKEALEIIKISENNKEQK